MNKPRNMLKERITLLAHPNIMQYDPLRTKAKHGYSSREFLQLRSSFSLGPDIPLFLSGSGCENPLPRHQGVLCYPASVR